MWSRGHCLKSGMISFAAFFPWPLTVESPIPFHTGSNGEYLPTEPGPREARMAEIDLGDLREAMSATIERAKENDPKALKAEVARLRAEVEQFEPVPVSKDDAAFLKERERALKVFERRLRKDHAAITKRLEPLLARAEKASTALQEAANVFRGALAPLPDAPTRPPRPAAVQERSLRSCHFVCSVPCGASAFVPARTPLGKRRCGPAPAAAMSLKKSEYWSTSSLRIDPRNPQLRFAFT